MGDVRRLAVLPVVTVMAGVSLSACYIGPDPVQFGALAVINGKATAVVAMCDRLRRDVRVSHNDDTPTREGKSWAASVTVPQSTRDVEVELLATAPAGPGSPATITVWDRILTSFEPGHRYTLNAADGGPEGTEAPRITFTTDDFARIGSGKVLAPIDYQKSAVVSRDSWVKQTCAKRGPGA